VTIAVVIAIYKQLAIKPERKIFGASTGFEPENEYPQKFISYSEFSVRVNFTTNRHDPIMPDAMFANTLQGKALSIAAKIK